VGVGLAIVLQLYRLRQSIAVDEVPLADEAPPPDAVPQADVESAPEVVPR
jgi:NADH-quinone oxidoreductase subunit K